MKQILSLILALTLVVSFTGCAVFEEEEEVEELDVEECLEEAEKLVEDGKLEEAEKLLKKGISKTDDNEQLWVYLEIVQAMMGDEERPNAETSHETTAPLPSTEATHTPATDAPQQPATPTVGNLLDNFGSDEMHKINVFLSNFSEQNFKAYPCDSERMINFGYLFAKINGGGMVYSDGSYYCVSKSDMDAVLNRFFGTTVDLQDPVTVSGAYGNKILYSGGVYHFPLADGESYSYCSVATSMVSNGNGTYTVTFNVYSHVNPHESMSTFYSMKAAQASACRDLMLHKTGIAVIRDYTRSNGVESYQLISYSVT